MRSAVVTAAALLAALLLLAAQPGGGRDSDVIILGVDGMDPVLLQQFIDEGVMPNLAALAERGDFSPLGTTMPPLSPVAWSSFITGMQPGGHGIYDFLHRDPATAMPIFAMAETLPPTWQLQIGSWVLPLAGGGYELKRRGRAFWQLLAEAGVDTTLFRMPANFPPVECECRSFAGMGTPDLLGTPGTFSFYTTDPPEDQSGVTGGNIYEVRSENGKVRAQLHGPPNPYLAATDGASLPELTVDFEVTVDSERGAARLDVADAVVVLEQGEWSDWITVDFSPIPLTPITANARFYLKEAGPGFQLYVSPLQVNPESPVLPLSHPADWSSELYEQLGPFYTQELPEETKAFSSGLLDGREFWAQAQIVLSERLRALDYFLDSYDRGLLFFYFSSVDQGSHMLWHYQDAAHPGFHSDDFLKDGIRRLYRQIDEAVGKVMRKLEPSTTLIVMSDHGFSPFYRQVNLNSWLLEKGYVTLADPARQGRAPLFANVDWSRTQAYSVGLNGLYVNLRGRESRGIVSPAAYPDVLDRLERDLLAMRDPATGEPVVTLVTRTRRDFKGDALEDAPDIIVGYNRGYRTSWKSPLGEFPREVLLDNLDPWSGDHSIDARLVPGVLLSNREIIGDSPHLTDLTVAVLEEFGVAATPEMIGKDCLGDKKF